MIDHRTALRELLEKSADADLLREMTGFAAERLMELEVQGLTRAGTVELRIPKLRKGSYFRASWSRTGSRRRRSRTSSRRPTCRASRPAAST
jgi:transposase-like protein